MKAKYFLAFAIFGASLAGAKNYEIVLNGPAKVGNLDLKPGKYGLTVDSSKVRFVQAGNGKSMETDGTVVNSQKKYKDTVINTKQIDGANHISEIELGGTSTKIQFE